MKDKKEVFVFLHKEHDVVKIFNVAVMQESEAKYLLKSCLKASLQIEYSGLTIEEEPDKKNGLFVLLEDRLMSGKFYPTGFIVQNKEKAQKWTTEKPVGVERKFEELTIMRPNDALHKIFQNN